MATRRTVLRFARLLQSRIRQEQLVPWLQKQTERQQLGGYQASDLLRPLECSTCVPCRGKKTAAQPNPPPPDRSTAQKALRYGVPVATAVVAVVGAPLALGAVGFGAGGIAAGSYAASLMSWVATTGYGAAALAAAQSAGAAGFGAAANVLIAGGGAALGEAVMRLAGRGRNRPPGDEAPREPNGAEEPREPNGAQEPREPNGDQEPREPNGAQGLRRPNEHDRPRDPPPHGN